MTNEAIWRWGVGKNKEDKERRDRNHYRFAITVKEVKVLCRIETH